MGKIKVYKVKVKIRPNGPGTQVVQDRYVLRPARYTTIDVKDLADHIAADSRIERSKISVITDSLIKQIEEMVLNGHKIQIPHLGSFKPRIKSQQAFSADDVDASTFIAKVAFNPSSEMKLELQSTKFETVEQDSLLQPEYEPIDFSEMLDEIKGQLLAMYENNYPDVTFRADDFALEIHDVAPEASPVFYKYKGQNQRVVANSPICYISCDGGSTILAGYQQASEWHVDNCFFADSTPYFTGAYEYLNVARFKASEFNNCQVDID